MDTHNKYNKKGGKVIASGGFGCVFNPALKCKDNKKRPKNHVSKLMSEENAHEEYKTITYLKNKLSNIIHYEDYFVLYDITLCNPAKLTQTDLVQYNKKCTALKNKSITKDIINERLDDFLAINLPNAGIPVDDYIYKNNSFKDIYKLHLKLVDLFKNGILPMNKKHIYHSDIKDSNVLVNEENGKLKTRLIDWGLTVEYEPNVTSKFPHNWRNRPLQFNVPFSVVIFTDLFYKKYTNYLKDGGKVETNSLRPFVISYLNEWMKERGAGHYKFINEIMFMLYSKDLSSIPEENKPAIVETEITMPYIIDYIVDVLVHYTKFKANGSLNLREYLNKVYIKIVDIWGFINIYFPLLELLYNNYFNMNEGEMKIFKQLQFIFNEYLFEPRHTQIDLKELYSDLKILGKLLYETAYNKKKSSSNKTKSSSSFSGGNKTKKHKKTHNKFSFKRKAIVKKFKNPFFLSIK